LESVEARAKQLREGLEGLTQKFSWLGAVRGMGLLLGVECQKPVGDLLALCQKHKLLALRAGATVLRLLPPLNLSEAEAAEGLRRLEAAFAEADAGQKI
jgi:acetylornithine/succinyldiaminopimelate/putrescine aminotransferase